MKRALVIAGLTVAAAVPATFGLIGNASFGQSVPVRIPPSAILVSQERAAVPGSSDSLTLSTSPITNLTTVTLTRSSSPIRTASRTEGSGHSSSRSTTRVLETEDDQATSSSAEPGDDRGAGVEPGDDRGAGVEPGHDRGAGVEPGHDRGTGHRGSTLDPTSRATMGATTPPASTGTRGKSSRASDDGAGRSSEATRTPDDRASSAPAGTTGFDDLGPTIVDDNGSEGSGSGRDGSSGGGGKDDGAEHR